jgi:LPXTG-motif cell wall-anchored protein
MFDETLRQATTITETSARVSDMIALDESGPDNQLWDINGVDPHLWTDEINVSGNTGIQYSLYTENPSLTRATPVALATNTTGNFTGLTAGTTYYVVAHSLESHNFLTGPTTQYEFTTGAENVPTPPTSETPADNITDRPTSDTTIAGDNWQNLPSTGEAASMLGGIGGAILAGLGIFRFLKRKNK